MTLRPAEPPQRVELRQLVEAVPDAAVLVFDGWLHGHGAHYAGNPRFGIDMWQVVDVYLTIRSTVIVASYEVLPDDPVYERGQPLEWQQYPSFDAADADDDVIYDGPARADAIAQARQKGARP